MEIPSSSTTSSSPTPTTTMSKLFQFIRWEEVLVSNEKGRREVHYYLIKKDGTKDFAVLGKERTIRHMSYSYVLPTLSSSSSYPLLPHKLKSRREVIDWLSSLVSDSSSGGLSQPIGGFVGNNDASDIPAFKDLHMRKLGNHSKEFLWLGSAWTCRKRRRHYQSFCRNGITVSVHDFIYVLAEENKRLVAYLEDLYEDSRGNKMVGVRWFHKIDEVGIVLPPNFNDREIFFSLCLQDLSVECIDGLATVLSPQHFEKFRKEVSNTQWKPFMCHRQFDNDDIEAFDITQVQGYWKQEILRQMYSSCPSKNLIPDVTADGLELGADDDDDDALRTRPKKKHRSSKSRDLDQQVIDKRYIKEPFNVDIQKASNTLVVGSSGAEISCLKEGSPATCFSMKNIDNQIPIPNLAVGCHVEVLSQDSGIRGCWFRAVVVKRHKNKVKVQYQDIKDAVDEANNLEEWVLSSRIATPDKLGLRLRGRTTVRPYPSSNRGKASLGLLDVGTSVDAWWHDGWWEGIVVRKESNVRVQVYFPGEGRMSNFGCNDLRRSQDWVCNKWNRIRKKPDLVISILSGLETRTDDIKSTEAASKLVQLMNESGKQIKTNSNGDHLPPKDEKASCTKTIPCLEPRQDERGKVEDVVPNLAKDNLLTMLKWNSSRKRRRSREGLPRRGSSGDGSSSSGRDDLMSPHASESFVIPNSLKLDTEICKYRGDSVLNATISTLTSLVMSR